MFSAWIVLEADHQSLVVNDWWDTSVGISSVELVYNSGFFRYNHKITFNIPFSDNNYVVLAWDQSNGDHISDEAISSAFANPPSILEKNVNYILMEKLDGKYFIGILHA